MGKHLDRAEILLDLDKYDLAEKELRQEIAENPDSDLAHGSLARCLINQRKLGAETLEIVEYALALNPENDWLHYLLAVYWHMSGNFDRAQTAIGVSIELDPNVSLYFDTLARILFDRGNDRFKTHSRRIMLIVFVFSRGLLLPIYWGIFTICKDYWIRSYLRPVIAPLEKSLSLDPEYLSALNLQTQLLIQTNRPHRALANSLDALRIDPSDDTAHRLHAQVLLILGKYIAARDHFQSALNIDPSSKESKAGLLEAVRSQYWVYPWISVTNWRGILVLGIVFSITVTLGISTIWFKSDGIFVFSICLVFIPLASISLAAKPIFNLFLQLRSKHRLLMTSSISIWGTILGNYIASLIIAAVSSVYLLSFLAAVLDNASAWVLAMAIPILLIFAGIFISVATFLPAIARNEARFLSTVYQSVVGGLGIVSIVATYCLGVNQVGTFYSIFFWLVIASPAVAFYISKYSCR
jgi:tetratricopeptide (TPR) repeat protein